MVTIDHNKFKNTLDKDAAEVDYEQNIKKLASNSLWDIPNLPWLNHLIKNKDAGGKCASDRKIFCPNGRRCHYNLMNK